jgi:hypothetical protein
MIARMKIEAYTTDNWFMDEATLIAVPSPPVDPDADSSATTAPMIDSGKTMRSAANRNGSALGMRRCHSSSMRPASIVW